MFSTESFLRPARSKLLPFENVQLRWTFVLQVEADENKKINLLAQ